MKKLMLICAPVSSRSGYGDHARDLVHSFIKHDKYDIKILDVPWGSCPRNALKNTDKKDVEIINRILPQPQMDRQPDVYVDIRIPNEFQQWGKVNIGITAGIETTIVSEKWIEGCNKMDLIIVPSEHSKDGFVKTMYEKIKNLPDGKTQKIGELKLEKPIEVLFEGVDGVYKDLKHDEIDSEFFDMLNEKVSEKFAFLFVGQWTAGGYGEDRKDISRMIKVFYESFANKRKQPALILKTNGATFSVLDRVDILKKIKHVKDKFPKDWKLPNVYLLHGDLSKEEINYLYNHPKIKAMVSFTHGEGFGRPLLEATMTGLPVIASGWSGQLDFLDKDKSLLIKGNFQKVPDSIVWTDIIVKDSQWFTVDESSAYKAFNYVFKNYFDVKRGAKSLMNINRQKFSLNKMAEKLDEIITPHLDKIPTQVGIKLPKLKKIDDSKPPKMKLPKLKKLTEDI